MKLTSKQKAKIIEAGTDWETIHILYDSYMENRLKVLDPEFLEDLSEVTKDATFWYA